jgi:hypothetical protein
MTAGPALVGDIAEGLDHARRAGCALPGGLLL